jgi:hypothetical protein
MKRAVTALRHVDNGHRPISHHNEFESCVQISAHFCSVEIIAYVKLPIDTRHDDGKDDAAAATAPVGS